MVSKQSDLMVQKLLCALHPLSQKCDTNMILLFESNINNKTWCHDTASMFFHHFLQSSYTDIPGSIILLDKWNIRPYPGPSKSKSILTQFPWSRDEHYVLLQPGRADLDLCVLNLSLLTFRDLKLELERLCFM